MDVLEEQLQVVHGSWSDGPFTFDGEHYSLRELDARPKPVQRPHPPIIIGGNAGPRSAALAARYADEYNTVFATPAEVSERRAVVERACEQAGREPLPFSLMTGVVLGRDRGELQDRARRLAELTGGDAPSFLAEPPSGWIVGTLEDAAAQVAALADAGVQRIMCQHLVHDDLDTVALIGRELPALL
jgi:alkanesulfonate monooxygenase SsuD/methylene tetrahydromethanopterin reductase-like flavin-dependent oxidoreductase (luciferase family)